MLPRAHRLTKSGDYARVRRDGRSRAHPLLILAAAPNGGEMTRVGIAVGKKVGTAVTRNRAKRLLREAARARLGGLAPGHDIVLIGRKDIAGAGFGDVSDALDTMLRRARLLATAPGGSRPGDAMTKRTQAPDEAINGARSGAATTNAARPFDDAIEGFQRSAAATTETPPGDGTTGGAQP